MAIREEVVLNLSKQTEYISIRLQQNDALEKEIDVTIINNGEIYDIPTNAIPMLKMLKTDGSPIIHKCQVVDNKVRFTINEQITAVKDRQPAQIKIINPTTGGTLKTLRFHMLIDEEVLNDDIVASVGEFTILDDALMRVLDAEDILTDAILNVDQALTAESTRKINENKRVSNEEERIANEVLRLNYYYVTQAEYDALPLSDKNNPKYVYEITDDDGEFPNELENLIDRTQNAASVAEELVIHRAGINDLSPTNTEAYSGKKVQNKFDEIGLNLGTVASQLQQKAKQTDLETEVINRTNAISAEQIERQSVVAVERARIDSFTTLSEGSTTGDAELIDGRIDANGTKHANSGANARFSQNGRLIDHNETAAYHGYRRFIPLSYENNGISYTNGNDITDNSSIRTPKSNIITFPSSITIFNKNNTKYRWRWIVFNADGSYSSFIGWNASIKTVIEPNQTLRYRMVIGTIDGSQIDLEDALKNIGIVNTNDVLSDNITPKMLNDESFALLDYILAIGGGAKPTFVSNSNIISVTLPNTSLFYRDNKGLLVAQSPSSYYGTTFSVASDQALIWNLDTNVIVVQSTTTSRNKRNVVLLYNLYGNVQDGAFKSYYDNQITNDNFASKDSLNDAYFKQNLQDKYYLKMMENSESWGSQGMTMVGDYFWNCSSAADDHSTYSSIRIYDEGLNARVGTITHNINHMNTVDYQRDTDVLLIGNATDDTSILPEIVLVRNVSDIPIATSGVRLEYTDERILVIPFNTTNKQLHNYGIGACWGEQKDIVYLIIGGKPGTVRIDKVLLGMGSNDLSDRSAEQSDLTMWGTYKDVGLNEYNGTAKVIGSWTGTNLGVNQDCFYHNGYLYGTFSRNYAQMAKIELKSNKAYSIKDSWWLPNYNNDGTLIFTEEGNGACLYKGIYYLSSFKHRLVKIPIYNKQGGKGNTGERIIFEFPMNSTPFINITPTSSVTDLYISSIDNKGFTCLSTSGGRGSFTWECMID